MRENGYSRSQRLRDMLRADQDPFAPLVDPPPPLGRAESSALRKGDLAEWVHLEDPAAIRSFSRPPERFGGHTLQAVFG
ncbi:hypothetical protein HK405_010078 [Cladochytrium tenue]|nr:hypothetical protein HK405_010078 [Cladochytrium tenue]